MLNSFFIFNGAYFKQVEGLGMGLPLGSTLANIFMCHHEEAAFAPAKYFRYIDDTFVIFSDKSHIEKSFDCVNKKPQYISFTHKFEQNNSLVFLDVAVSRVNDQFSTSVFRKSTFS